MRAHVEVKLLGPVEVLVDSRPVPLPGSSPRVVLARLALAVGRVIPTGDLVDTLWLDDPPANAIGNLQSYVSRLRRAIGRDLVGREPGGYSLLIPAENVDVRQVEMLAAAAREAPGPGARADRLGEALALWRGQPLGGLPETMMFAPDLARLTEWRLQLEEDWFHARLEAGQAASTLPDLEAAATAQPERERLYLLLMRALHNLGRTAEGLRVADGFRRRLGEESGLEPSSALVELEGRLLADDPGLQPPGLSPEPLPPARIPRRRAPGDRFVGRQAELALVRERLANHRAVTVVGSAGMGKSRLVLELIDSLDEKTPTYLSEFAEVSADEEVPAAVAESLGLQAAREGVANAIADRLSLEPALLVMDNCEHVAAAVRHLAADLLARCPQLRILASSRRRLGVAAEQVVRLEPLAEADQAELFYDRARAVRGDLPDSAEARALVLDICRLVDGVPLGLELAARREAVFGLTQLRDRLAAGLDVIDDAQQVDRSTTMTATIEWSYRLVEPAARILFDRLAVCRGGFPLEAVEHLAPPGGAGPAALLAELVEASLVVADLAVEPPRYRLLEAMYHVARSHSTEREWDDARALHAGWMISYGEAMHRQKIEATGEATTMLRREGSNLREALGYLMDAHRWKDAGELGVKVAVTVSDDPHLDLLAQLRRLVPPVEDIDSATALCAVAGGAFYSQTGETLAGRRLLAAALEETADHPLGWTAAYFHLFSSMFTGDWEALVSDIGYLRRHPQAPPWARAVGVCCAALFQRFSGDAESAVRWLEDDRELLTARGSEGFVAYTRGELAAESDPDQALALFEDSHRSSEDVGHTYNRELAAVGAAAVLIRTGRVDEASAACRALLRNLRRLGMSEQLSTTLGLVAGLLASVDDHASAAVLLAAVEADELSPAVYAPERTRRADLWASIEAAVGADATRAARRQVRDVGFGGAVQLALDRLA